MEDVIEARCSEGKGEHHTRHRHRCGLNAHGDELIKFALQAGEEQERKQADLGNGLKAREGFVVDLSHFIGPDLCEGT